MRRSGKTGANKDRISIISTVEPRECLEVDCAAFFHKDVSEWRIELGLEKVDNGS